MLLEYTWNSFVVLNHQVCVLYDCLCLCTRHLAKPSVVPSGVQAVKFAYAVSSILWIQKQSLKIIEGYSHSSGKKK